MEQAGLEDAVRGQGGASIAPGQPFQHLPQPDGSFRGLSTRVMRKGQLVPSIMLRPLTPFNTATLPLQPCPSFRVVGVWHATTVHICPLPRLLRHEAPRFLFPKLPYPPRAAARLSA